MRSSGIDKFDAVGFVVPTSLPRLTPTQCYIFESTLSLFGRDIAENFSLVLTFADEQIPPVLSAIQDAKLPCETFYKFNNSSVFVNSKKAPLSTENEEIDDNFDEMFWKMGEKSFGNFLQDLSKVHPSDLTLTKEVLLERNNLEVIIDNLHATIKAGTFKLEELTKNYETLRNHLVDIDRNRNYEYTISEEITETKKKKKATRPGQYTTNSLNCNITCHTDCPYNDDDDKKKCTVMEDGCCTICPNQCSWDMHKNHPYVYVVRTLKVVKTSEKLKKNYQQAEGKKAAVQEVITKNKRLFKEIEVTTLYLTEQGRQSLARLDEIALRPNPLSTVEYIETLKRNEESTADPGWQKRVDQLCDIEEKSGYLEKLREDGFDPFAEYNSLC